MDCDRCRELLSDLLDGELHQAEGREVKEHCVGCVACRTELQEVRAAAQALRDAGRDAPPAGLEEAILARLRELPPRAVFLARPEAKLRARRVSWAAAAAILILGGLASVSLVQLARTGRTLAAREGEIADLAGRIAGMERDLGAGLERWSSERSALAAEIGALTRELTGARASADAARARRDEERRLLESRVAMLEERERLEVEGIRALETSIAAVSDEAGRLREELKATRAVVRVAEMPTASEDPQRASSRETRILFRRRGDVLEMEMRGPRESVVPELFRIAWGGGERASLAVTALESLVGREGSSEGIAERPANGDEIPGLWSRLGVAIGIAEAPGAPRRDAATDGTERLRALERRWLAEAQGSGLADVQEPVEGRERP